MKIIFDKLPKKAKKKKDVLYDVLEKAEDSLYSISKVDYNTGTITFESLLNDVIIIQYYVSTGTIVTFNKIKHKTKYFRRLKTEEIKNHFKQLK